MQLVRFVLTTSFCTSTNIEVPADAVDSFSRATRALEPARPISSLPLTASPLQVDRLPSLPQLQEEEQRRRESTSACTISPPLLNTRQKDSKAQNKAWSSLPQDQSQQTACKCLQSIVSLLEELENRASTIDTHPLDSVLAYQKEALNHCSRMVGCSPCAARSDYMMLLGVVSDKLISSYEHVITKHTESTRKRVDNNEDEDGTSSSSSSSFRAGTEGGAEYTRIVSFGCYKIDGAAEWKYVSRVLITLQLRQVFGLLAQMQHIAERTARGPQVSALRIREQRLKAITEKFKHFAQV